MVDCENGHAGSHQCHNKIFVERIGFSEYREVEEHDGKELARFGKYECYIIDVSERSVPKRGGQRGSYCHQYKREKY